MGGGGSGECIVLKKKHLGENVFLKNKLILQQTAANNVLSWNYNFKTV